VRDEPAQFFRAGLRYALNGAEKRSARLHFRQGEEQKRGGPNLGYRSGPNRSIERTTGEHLPDLGRAPTRLSIET
jgi:hypothetical protein